MAIYLNGRRIRFLEKEPFSAIQQNFQQDRNAIARHWWKTGTCTRFTGRIDDFRLYKRALSQEEVEKLYEFESNPDRKKVPPKKNASVFPGWEKFAVHQRRPKTGCIPTGYEMLLRSAGVNDVDFDSFQDEFDLDQDLGKGQTTPQNHFVSVAQAVQKKYPDIVFEQQVFEKGSQKVAFIDKQIKGQKPLLVSVAMVEGNKLRGWHIMPLVDADATRYCLLRYVEANGQCQTQWVDKKALADLHDHYEGGKEVAYLKSY